MPDVLLVTLDLMGCSWAQAAARSANCELQVAGSSKGLGDADDSPRLVLVDLETSAAELDPIIAWAAEQQPSPQVIAYGPHVQQQRLDQAAAAGCDSVLTRGQLHRQLDAMLAAMK